MMKFDSSDVEAERRSDEIFETLNVFTRAEIAKGKVYRDDGKGVDADVCRCLERRCRAWYASTPDAFQAQKSDLSVEVTAEQAAEIRRIAQMAYGDELGHDDFRVDDESIPEPANDYNDGGYWVQARVWVPLSWVKASEP